MLHHHHHNDRYDRYGGKSCAEAEGLEALLERLQLLKLCCGLEARTSRGQRRAVASLC
jgi:hypothetical protein